MYQDHSRLGHCLPKVYHTRTLEDCSSQIVTTNKPTPNFLQAGCPSCHPTNSVKALNAHINGKYTTIMYFFCWTQCNVENYTRQTVETKCETNFTCITGLDDALFVSWTESYVSVLLQHTTAVITTNIHKFLTALLSVDGGRVVRMLDLQSAGRGFKSWPLHCRVQPRASC